jgi:hypothetical protein
MNKYMTYQYSNFEVIEMNLFARVFFGSWFAVWMGT